MSHDIVSVGLSVTRRWITFVSLSDKCPFLLLEAWSSQHFFRQSLLFLSIVSSRIILAHLVHLQGLSCDAQGDHREER
jgi:hypothetical protein